jgi:hypothetical protein
MQTVHNRVTSFCAIGAMRFQFPGVRDVFSNPCADRGHRFFPFLRKCGCENFGHGLPDQVSVLPRALACDNQGLPTLPATMKRAAAA